MFLLGPGVIEQHKVKHKLLNTCYVSDNSLLPSVPPITVSVPENYPKESPTWEPLPHDYGKPHHGHSSLEAYFSLEC